jgi:hypothetical protein
MAYCFLLVTTGLLAGMDCCHWMLCYAALLLKLLCVFSCQPVGEPGIVV